MKLEQLINYLESFAPLSLQENYDNSGLITGDISTEISGIYFSLDVTERVIEEAVLNSCNVIISHHPLIFTGLKKLTGSNYVERTLLAAIKNNIALYGIHTNLDNVRMGVNEMMARKLGLQNYRVLKPVKGHLKKLVTFVPEAHADALREALFSHGAGSVGNYDNCSFNISGTGTFRGNEHTHPFAGEKLKDHREAEVRIEVIYPAWAEKHLLSGLRNNHPYEEVAYDIYQLDNTHQDIGAGLIGDLGTALEETAFLDLLKKTMHTASIRHTALLNRPVQKVAVCGGSGSFLLKDAIAAGAQVFVSADFKYHQFFDADGRIVIADIGHYESEQFTVELLLELIRKKFANFALHLKSGIDTNPVKYY